MRSEAPWRRLVPLALVLMASTTAAQLDPLLLRGPYLQSPTPESIVVRWRSDFPTDSRVRYGTAAENLDQEVTVPGARVDHEVLLDGLQPATRYYYAVGSSLVDLSSGADHTFLTPPVAGTRQPVRIWTFGDSGWGTTPEEGIADRMRDGYLAFTGERGTDVWILLGDNAYVAGTDGEYQVNFFDLFSGVLRGVPAWSTFGNHENFVAFSTPEACADNAMTGDECGDYYDMFTFTAQGEAGGVASDREAWHSFDYGNVHFLNLNSQDVDRTPGSPMLTWLEQDLAANSQEWTIAYFHHPVYSNGTHPTDTDTGEGSVTPPTPADDFAIQQMREHVLPILEAGGVDLVLTAHSHNYERSFLLDGHYGTSDTLTPAMVLDSGDGATDGDGAYRKAVGLFDDAHSGTVYAVVGTGSQAATARGHDAIRAVENRVGSLVIDVDGAVLNAMFVAADGSVGDHFTIVRGLDNAAPTANDDAVATAPATPVGIDVLANDSDPEDDLLTVQSITQPALGTATVEPDDTVTYTPGPELAEGTDSFTYTVNDGHGNTATATVTVTVTCPPLADGLFSDDLEPGPEPGWTFDPLLNDNPLSTTWTIREDPNAHSPTHVWFSESNENTSQKDDRLTSPPLDLSTASRLTFWHYYNFEQGFDGGVLEISTDAGATWEDLGEAMVNGGYGTGQISVFLGPTRPAWTGVSGPPMSRVEVDLGAYAGPDRLIRWRLFADYITLDPTVGWFLDDVEVTALVTGPGDCNLPPIARDDFAATESDTAVNIAVLANDSDPDGDPISLASVGAPANGTADAEADGSVTYTPAPGFAGADSFPYEITDGEATAGAVVRIAVTAPPLPSRARGNGTIDDDADSDSDAEFAFNARRDEDGEVTGWLTYDTDDDSDSDSDGDSDGGDEEDDPALDGSVRELTFLGGGRVVLEGAGFLKDGRFVTFRATAEDRAHPGAGVDRFGIEIFDAGGNRIYAAEGAITSGEVILD